MRLVMELEFGAEAELELETGLAVELGLEY